MGQMRREIVWGLATLAVAACNFTRSNSDGDAPPAPIVGFATHEIAKVYHLDAVVRVAGSHHAAHLERWRVVFSRAGIERIEPGG